MLSDRIWIYIALLCTVTCLSLLTIFILNPRVDWIKSLGIFAYSPKDIARKYYIKNGPGTLLMISVWVVTFASKLTCLPWLIKMDKAKIRVFPKEFYFNWAGGMSLTIIWLFMFDHEQHVINVPVLGGILAFAFRNTVWACRRLELTKSEMAAFDLQPLPADALRGFHSYVITTYNAEVLWTFAAAPAILVYPIAYVTSSHVTEAIERGILSVEASSTVGIWFLVLIQIFYTVLDFSVYRRYTKHLWLFHPGLIYVMLGTFQANYDSEIGFTPNNMNCLMMTFISAGEYILRRWFWNPTEIVKKMT